MPKHHRPEPTERDMTDVELAEWQAYEEWRNAQAEND